MEVWLNSERLSSASGNETFGAWSRLEWTGFPTRLAQISYSGATIQFDLTGPPLKKGENELEVRLLRSMVQKSEQIVLIDVEVKISYA